MLEPVASYQAPSFTKWKNKIEALRESKSNRVEKILKELKKMMITF